VLLTRVIIVRPPERREVPARAATATSEMQTKKTSKRAFMGRFPVLHQFAGFAWLFGFSAFISLISSGVI
jgi:hypothetical protein